MSAPSKHNKSVPHHSSGGISVQPDALNRIAHGIYQKNEELAETNRILMLLRRIDKVVLGSITDSEEVIRQVAEAVAEDAGFPFTAIYLRNHSKVVLEPQAVIVRGGNNEKLRQELITSIRQNPISLKHPRNAIVRAAKHLFIGSTKQLYELTQPFLEIDRAHDAQEELGLQSFFVCPIYARDDALGVMVLGSREPLGSQTFYQMDLLERITIAVGIAVDDTLLYSKTIETAEHLRATNRRLKDLDKAKDEFISMASHQLRTPLTSIKGYISMLSEGDAGPLAAEQKQYLAYAYNSTNRMVELISDLLNVSRMQAGRFSLDLAPANLTSIIADEVQSLQSHANPKDIKLIFTPPKQAIQPILIDENKTRQVVMNFIDNALYYTRKGSISVTLKKVDDRLEFRVKDTGIGVPKSSRAKLFTKFYRAGNAQTLRPDGTGLGLYMAKRVIEDQGGTIIFESEEDKGSTFGFALPLIK